MKLQSFLINKILTPLSRLSNRMDARARKCGFMLSVQMILWMAILYKGGFLTGRYVYVFIFAAGCILTGLMIFFSLPPVMKPIRFDTKLAVCWFGVGLFTLLSAVRFEPVYLSEAIMYLFVYPVAFIVWNNADWRAIFRMLTQSAALSFLLYFIITWAFIPIKAKENCGLFGNENSAAMYLTITFCCILFEVLLEQKVRVKVVGLYVLLGLNAALLFYTNSRGGALSAACALIFTVLLFIANQFKKQGRYVIYRIVPIFLSLAVFIPLTVYIYQVRPLLQNTVKSLSISSSVSSSVSAGSGGDVSKQSAASSSAASKSSTCSAGVTSQTTSSAASKSSTPSVGAASQATSSVSPQSSAASPFFGTDQFFSRAEIKTNIFGRSLDEITSGRTAIWRTYFRHIRFFGSGEEEKFFVEERNCYYTNPHNDIVEYAFHSGIPCAILYLLFFIFAGVKSIRFARRNSDDVYALLPFLVTVAFFICSMLESLNASPYTYPISFYYFLVQTPLMVKITWPSRKRTASDHGVNSAVAVESEIKT